MESHPPSGASWNLGLLESYPPGASEILESWNLGNPGRDLNLGILESWTPVISRFQDSNPPHLACLACTRAPGDMIYFSRATCFIFRMRKHVASSCFFTFPRENKHVASRPGPAREKNMSRPLAGRNAYGSGADGTAEEPDRGRNVTETLCLVRVRADSRPGRVPASRSSSTSPLF